MAKKQTKTVRKKSAKNGKPNGTKKRKAVSSSTKKLSLSDEDKGLLLPMNQELRQLKLALADAQMSILKLESKRIEIAEKISGLDQAMLEKAKGVARDNGIDVDDLSQRWKLDLEGGVFTRVG